MALGATLGALLEALDALLDSLLPAFHARGGGRCDLLARLEPRLRLTLLESRLCRTLLDPWLDLPLGALRIAPALRRALEALAS